MPDPTGTKNDGGLVHGSQIVTINGVEYIAESFSPTRGSNWLESMNQYGVPNKQAGKITIPTGSSTLQLAASTTVAPPMFTEFTAVPVGGAAPLTWIVSEVGELIQHDGETKVNISFRLKLNA